MIPRLVLSEWETVYRTVYLLGFVVLLLVLMLGRLR